MLDGLQHEMAHQFRDLDIMLLREVMYAPLFISGQPDAEHRFAFGLLIR